MSEFTQESEDYLLIRFTDEEFHQIRDILNKLILTENPEEIFTRDEIEHIAYANKYTNVFFYYALYVSENIQTHQGEMIGGGIKNTVIFFILLLLTFNTVLVDAGILKQTALHFEPIKSIHHSMSQKKISNSVIELSKTVIQLSDKLRKYTPPLMKDIVNMSTMTKHTASITQIVVQKQKRIYNLSIYILEKMLLGKIKSVLKKKIVYFIYSCFIKGIAPLFFPELQIASIQLADIVLWCIQNKILETFKWSKRNIAEIMDIYEGQITYNNYFGGKNSIKQKKRSFIRSKKNIKHRKKNTKITIKKTMMNGMMFPK
jgi:hypothetical protein